MPPKIFLSYVREDCEKVQRIYQKLKDKGFCPWIDSEDMLPGENWKKRITREIKASDLFIVCLSRQSLYKSGHFQKEIKEALSVLGEKSETDIYLVPLRLEECDIPEQLNEIHCCDYFQPNGWNNLLKTIDQNVERKKERLSRRSMQSNKPEKLFLVAPRLENDLATELTIQWANEFKEKMSISSHNFDMLCLLGKDAIRPNIENLLKQHIHQTGLFVFIDHGENDQLIGSDGRSIIDLDNIGLLNNKFIYAIACRSGAELGYAALNSGAVGYMGFNNDFHIITSATKTFCQCFLSGVMALLQENKSPLEARERVKIEVGGVIDKLKHKYHTTKDARLPIIVNSLKHNMNFMVCLGDYNWRIH